MKFEKEKKDCLSKIDKSKKGSIDKKIKKLVELINLLNKKAKIRKKVRCWVLVREP